MSSTPAKYQPEPRPFDDKATLYELYWGEFLPVREIAEQFGVAHCTIRERMDEMGIPRRADNYTRENSTSPFTGFYKHRSAPTDAQSRTVYDEDYDNGHDDGEFEWAFTDYQRGER